MKFATAPGSIVLIAAIWGAAAQAADGSSERRVIAPKDVQYEVTITTAVPNDHHGQRGVKNRCTKDGVHLQIIGTDAVMPRRGVGAGHCGGNTVVWNGISNEVGNVGPAIAVVLTKHGWDDWHHGPVTVKYKVRGEDGEFHTQVESKFSREGWMQAWGGGDSKHSWVLHLMYWEDGFGSKRKETVTRRIRESWKVVDARYSEKPVKRSFTETVRVTKEDWRQRNTETEKEVDVRLEVEGTNGVVGVSSARVELEVKTHLRKETRTEKGSRNEVMKEVVVDWEETASPGTIVLLQNTFNATGTREVVALGAGASAGAGKNLVIPIDVTEIERSTRPVVFKKSANDGRFHVWENRYDEQRQENRPRLGRMINEFEKQKICQLLGKQACMEL